MDFADNRFPSIFEKTVIGLFQSPKMALDVKIADR